MSPWAGLYNVALWAAAPIVGPWYLARGVRAGKYWPVLRQRLGLGASARPAPGAVWLHAVSVGEVKLARTLALAMRRQFQVGIVLSSTTLTGLALARQAHAAGEVDGVVVAPLDFRGAVRRVFEELRPRALVLIEAELWPNWLGEAERRGVNVALVNARVTARSASRYAFFAPLFRPLFRGLTAVGARGTGDRDRLVALGVAADRVAVTGDVKFDAAPPASDRLTARRAFRLPELGLVVVAGSTHPSESEAVLATFRRLRAAARDVTFVVAPRKDLSAAAGDDVVTRSGGGAVASGQILWLDTIGELASAYAAADVAFVGGSLVDAGGQNLVEPAACGIPVVFGPHCENFADVARGLLAAGGGVQVADDQGLERALTSLLGDAAERSRRGAAARALVAGGRGAVARTLALLAPMLAPIGVSRENAP